MEKSKSMFLDDYAKKTYKLFLLFTVLIGLVIAGLSFIKPSFAADEDEDSDYSYYNVSSSITSFYDQMRNQNVDKIAGEDKPGEGFYGSNFPMGSAGSFVGYADKDISKGPIGALTSAFTSAEQNRAYTMFSVGGDLDGNIRAYMEYGHALKELGLDTTISSMSKFGRIISGAILGFAYILAVLSDIVMSFVVAVLKFFNPFSWFKLSNTLDSAMMSDITNANNAFAGVIKMVSEWYDAISNLGLLLSAFFFMVAIGAFMFANRAAGNLKSPFKKLLTRTAFIILFVPVMGGLYTSALDNLGDNLYGSYGASSIINSLLLDFENWAQRSALDLPDGVIISVKPNDVKGAGNVYSNRNPRSIANAINSTMITNKMADVEKTSNGGMTDGLVHNEKFDSESIRQFADTWDLIKRYLNATTYDAATYETYSKKMYYRGASAMAGIKEAGTVEFYAKGGPDGVKPKEGDATPEFDVIDNSKLVATNTGNILIQSSESGLSRGLSDIAMYNYLNSNFTDSQVTTSSSSKQSSKMVTKDHSSVSLVGQGGASKFTNYTLTISMLLVLGCLGFFYGLGLLANSFGKGIRLIVNMFPAMGGSFRGMSKMVMIALSMIVEIFMTVVAYAIAKDLFLAANAILVEPLSELFKPAGFDISNMAYAITFGNSKLVFGADYGVRRGLLSVLFSIIGTFVNLFLGIKLIRLRVVLVKGLNEMLSGITDNLFGKVSGTDINGAREEAGKPGSGEALAKAAGAAGGTFAAGRAINKLTGGKDKDSEDGEGKDGDVKGKDSADKAQGEDVKGSKNQLAALSKGKDGKDSDDKKDTNKEDKNAKSRADRDGGALVAPSDSHDEDHEDEDQAESKGEQLLNSDVTSLEDADNIESIEGDNDSNDDSVTSDNSVDDDSDVDVDNKDDRDIVDDRDVVDDKDNITVAGEGDSAKKSDDVSDAKSKAEKAKAMSKEGNTNDKTSKDSAKPSEGDKAKTSENTTANKDGKSTDSKENSTDKATVSPTEGDKPNKTNSKDAVSETKDGKTVGSTSTDTSSNNAKPTEGDKLDTKKKKTVILTDTDSNEDTESKEKATSNVSTDAKASPTSHDVSSDTKDGKTSNPYAMTDRSKDSARNAKVEGSDNVAGASTTDNSVNGSNNNSNTGVNNKSTSDNNASASVHDNSKGDNNSGNNSTNENNTNGSSSNVNTASGSNNGPTEEEIEKIANKSKAKRFADAAASSMDAGYTKDGKNRQGDMFGLESMSDPRLRNYGQEGSTNPYAKSEEAKATEAKEKAQRTTIAGANTSSNTGGNVQTNTNNNSNVNNGSNAQIQANNDSNINTGSNMGGGSNRTVNAGVADNMSDRDRANIGSNISNGVYSSDGSYAASNRVGGYDRPIASSTRDNIVNDGSGGTFGQVNNVRSNRNFSGDDLDPNVLITKSIPNSAMMSLRSERKLDVLSDDELKDIYNVYNATDYLNGNYALLKRYKNMRDNGGTNNPKLDKIFNDPKMMKLFEDGEKMEKYRDAKFKRLAKKYNLDPLSLMVMLDKAKKK